MTKKRTNETALVLKEIKKTTFSRGKPSSSPERALAPIYRAIFASNEMKQITLFKLINSKLL